MVTVTEFTDDSHSTRKKSKWGCGRVVFRIFIVLLCIVLIDVVIPRAFKRAYPPDLLTENFIPFQNEYVAFTDAYITSEGFDTGFLKGISSTIKILTATLIVIPSLYAITLLLSVIPFTRWLVQYLVWLYVPTVLLTWSACLIIPDTKTVFDRPSQQLIVTNYSWLIIRSSTIIEFKDVDHFEYKLEESATGRGTKYKDLEIFDEYIRFYVISNGSKLFIAENLTGSHGFHDKTWGTPEAKKREADSLLDSLHKIVREHSLRNHPT